MALSFASVRTSIAGISPAITRLAAAIIGIGVLMWAGLAASRAGSARRAELRQAQSVLATFADWRRRYQPAVAAESIAWRRTMLEIQALGVVGDERLGLARALSRAAETAGLRDVRVIIQPADTTGSAERLSTEGVQRLPASFGLAVECRGNLQAIVSFLGELPPSVAPTQLILLRQDGRARHRITLAVYELEFSNGPPTLWTPLERSDPRPVGGDRGGS
jgi:hypothetical protein